VRPVPTQVEFRLGFKTCLPALLEAGDKKSVMTAHRLFAAAPEDEEIDGQSAAVSWAWASQSPPYLAKADLHVNHAAARQEWLERDDHADFLSAVQVEFRGAPGHAPALLCGAATVVVGGGGAFWLPGVYDAVRGVLRHGSATR